jgi:2-iminobutanoate/2-iminopropanoate deaminase
MRTVIQPPELPSANSTYSQAIQAGGFIFISGQIGVNPATGRLAGDDIAEQAKQAIENLVAILHAAGSALDNVVSVNIYLTEYGELARVNQVYGTYFPRNGPSKTSCGVTALYGGAKFEIQATALA